MYDNQKSNKINPNRRLGTAHLAQLFFFFFTLAPSLFGANYWIRRHKHHREISRKRKCRIQLFDASGQAVRAEMAYWESGTLGFSPNLSFLSPHLITFFFVLFSCYCILFSLPSSHTLAQPSELLGIGRRHGVYPAPPGKGDMGPITKRNGPERRQKLHLLKNEEALFSFFFRIYTPYKSDLPNLAPIRCYLVTTAEIVQDALQYPTVQRQSG